MYFGKSKVKVEEKTGAMNINFYLCMLFCSLIFHAAMLCIKHIFVFLFFALRFCARKAYFFG